jgi:hypothetical protein
MDIDKLEDKLEIWKHVNHRMDNEGIEYCFKQYSNWEEIEDDDFHKLKKDLIKNMKEIREFVQSKIEKLEDEIDNYDLEDN